MPVPVTSKKKQRRCVACGASADKRSLHRIVRSKDGHVAFDPTGRAAGRGAYVCSEACFQAARASRKLDRALKASLSADDYERVAQGLAAQRAEEQ